MKNIIYVEQICHFEGNLLFKSIVKSIKNIGKNTVYYPGCLTKFAGKDIQENYLAILNKIGIDFITLPEFACCGSPVLNAGYEEDYNNLKEENIKLFKKFGVKKIITNCPSCFKMFRDLYQLEDIDVEHITQTIWKNIKKFEKGQNKGKICYHDPCHLGRCSGVYEDPRNILEYLGYEVVEMEKSGKDSMCCGGGGGVKSNFPKESNMIAKARLKQCKEKKLVTPCTLCFKQFKENSDGIEIKEFSEVII